MQTAISSTEAVRNFSELLNNIRYRGDRYTVIRGGKPAASLVPVDPSHPESCLGELKEIFLHLPQLDHDDTSFAADIIDSAALQPPLQEGLKWE